jgi:serine/threonine-protein kinase
VASRNESTLRSDQPAREFSQEQIRQQLARISGSAIFAGSERMKRFLRLVVEYSLNGHGSELKEYLIGVEVFDRNASFDPRADPIVRVEARRLRSKLKSYYDSVGQQDELLIEFPKGAYAPEFRRRGSLDSLTTESVDIKPNSIAILPFRNLGPEPDNEYFSDGLSEELIHLLTRVPGLQVVAWHSSAQLKNAQEDLARVRQQLNVETVLCGSVRRAGEQLRITAQLVATRDGRYLWSEVYERRLHDLFAIEEEIAQAIVNTLQASLRLARPSRAAVRSTSDTESHNAYLLGRFHSNRRTAEGLRKSIDCFERSIALHPENAQAYSGLADSYCLLAEYAVMDPAESVPRANEAARRALELDPLLAEAYASLAFIRTCHDWEWREAERLFRRAIELNPGYATAHHWYAVDHLAMLGRMEQAFEELEISLQLDPLSAIALEGKGYLFLLSRRYDEAVECHRELLELDPFFHRAFSSIGRALAQQGKYTEALEMFEKTRSLAGTTPNLLGAMGQTYAWAGMESRARGILGELSELARHTFVPATSLALVHAGLGENEAALAYLEKGAERRDLNLTPLKMHPAYDSIRPEPRFQALLRQIGLIR